MAGPLADSTRQDSASGPPANGSNMSLAEAKKLAHDIKHLEARVHQAEFVLKDLKQRSTNTEGHARPPPQQPENMEPKSIEISEFLLSDTSSLSVPEPPPPPAPGLEAQRNPRGEPMTKEQARDLAEDIKTLEHKAYLAEQWVANWCGNQPTVPHHPGAWGLYPYGQPWHHAPGSAQAPNTPRTTVMLKNVPSNTDRDTLEDILRRNGFDKKFDLLYAPGEWNTGQGRGYAFVNMESPQDAEALMKVFYKRKDTGSSGGKSWWSDKAQVAWAKDQGLDTYLKYWQNHQVMHPTIPEKFKPAYFVDGQRQNFPEPTKSIKKPRIPGRPDPDDKEFSEKILPPDDTIGGDES